MNSSTPPSSDETLSYQDFSRCEHDETELRVFTASNGVKHYRYQCLQCGRNTKTVKKADIRRPLTRISDWDNDLQQRWFNERYALYQRVSEVQRERKNQEFWDWYDQYLQTEKWGRIRERVLSRADGICEGCGRRKATQVHHLSYTHVGEEFLFELVAICRDCHGRLHPQHIKDEPRLLIRESSVS